MTVTVWEKISRWCLYGIILLTPIFFLPLTIFPVTINKQILLVSLVFLSFISWLVGSIVKGKISYIRTPFNLIIGALLVITIASVLFSGSWRNGFFGINGSEVDAFTNLLAFGLLFFLVSNVFNGTRDINLVFKLLAASTAAALLFALLQLLGFWLLPWPFTHSVAFNTIGTTNGLAVYLGAAFLVLFSFLNFDVSNWPTFWKKAAIAGAAAIFITVFLLGFWPIFAGWLAAVVLFWVMRRGQSASMLVGAVSALALLVYLSILPLRLSTFNLPPEVTPSLKASWDISWQTVRQDVKTFFVGSGPTTYQYQYSMYRDKSLNTTPFWSARFSQGFNAIITHFAQNGFLGAILWLLFIGAAAVWSLNLVLKANAKRYPSLFAAVVGLLFLLLMLFFYPQNFVLYFSIFLLLGLAVRAAGFVSKPRFRSLNLMESSRRVFILSVAILAVIVMITSVLYLHIQYYLAAVYFAKGVASLDKDGNVEGALPYLLKAQDWDSRNDLYLRNLSTAYLLLASDLLKQQLPPEELRSRFAENIGAAVQAARKAVEINRFNSVNWINLADVYENLIPVVSDSGPLAFDAYEKAIELEPNNPSLYLRLGRAHLAEANKTKSEEEYKAAADNFKKALELKPDYTPAQELLDQ